MTTFMNLTLPTVSVTLGPDWASEVNAAIETIDSHDHTSGKGARIPTAGLNIDDDLDFNNNSAQNISIVGMEQRTSSPSGTSFAASTSVYNGDLYYTNASGVAIQLTSGGSVVSPAGSAQIFETQAVSSDLVIAPSSTFVYLIVDTTAIRTITLPLASGVSAGRIYIIKDSSGQSNSNNITVSTSGSDTVDGSSSQVLNSNYGSWMIIGDGSDKWYIS